MAPSSLILLALVLFFMVFSQGAALAEKRISSLEATACDCDLYVDSKTAPEESISSASRPGGLLCADNTCDKCADLVAHGKYPEAVTCYDGVISRNRSAVNAKYNKAFALYKFKDYNSAIYQCDKVIEDKDKGASRVAVSCARNLRENAHTESLISQGFNLTGPTNEGFIVQKLVEVLRNYDNILDENPYFASAWNNKGLVLSKLGRYQESLECFEKAREIDPLLAEAWNNKGVSLDYLNRHDDAIFCYGNALRVKPTAISWCNMGYALSIGKGNLTGALDCYNHSLKIDSNYTEAWYGKGLALMHLDKKDASDECFTQAAKLDASSLRLDHNEKGAWVYIEAFGLPSNYHEGQAIEIPYAFFGDQMVPLDDQPRLSEYNSSSFVNYDEIRNRVRVMDVKSKADMIAMPCSGDSTINQVNAIYRYVVDGWSYVSDPIEIDSIKYSNDSLNQVKNTAYSGVGDCEDYSILLAALVGSIGGTTRINQACGLTACHAYPEVYLGKAGAEDHRVEKILAWLKDKYNTDRIVIHRNPVTDEVWLNLDANYLWRNRDRSKDLPGGSLFEGDRHQAGATLSPIKKPLNLVSSIDLNHNDWDNPQRYITNGSNLAIESRADGCGDELILRYNLVKDGWAGVKKVVDPVIFFDTQGIKITYQGDGALNTLEIKLTTKDASYWKWLCTNTNGYNTKEIGYNEFIQWMRMDGQNVRKDEPLRVEDIRFVEIAVSNKEGNITGEGQLTIKNLEVYS